LKQLFLLRHAKSGWGDPRLADHDRPLAPRGERAVPKVALQLSRWLDGPLLVLCSTALRTRQTLAHVESVLTVPVAVEVERGLYLASASALLERVQGVDVEVGRVLVIGHNPGICELAADLCDPAATHSARLRNSFPTAALARLEFEVADWGAVEFGEGRLVAFVRPKDLD
jgi:phosphohistidine phosphatase